VAAAKKASNDETRADHLLPAASAKETLQDRAGQVPLSEYSILMAAINGKADVLVAS
jgi:hypothetical protein